MTVANKSVVRDICRGSLQCCCF